MPALSILWGYGRQFEAIIPTWRPGSPPIGSSASSTGSSQIQAFGGVLYCGLLPLSEGGPLTFPLTWNSVRFLSLFFTYFRYAAAPRHDCFINRPDSSLLSFLPGA
jgi:hypothetical protein